MENKKQKDSTVSWILHWAARAKGPFVLSIVFAVLKVVFKLIPYFIIGGVVSLFMDGEKRFDAYILPVGIIVGSFILGEVSHLISTSTSHKVTFEMLGQIKKEALDKLARVPLGYVKDGIHSFLTGYCLQIYKDIVFQGLSIWKENITRSGST